MSTNSPLPPLQTAWLEAAFGRPLPPSEPRATCARCAMREPPSGPDGAPVFDELVRCCTYVPILHNFLVGRMLADPEPPLGLASVRARMASGIALTPLGMDWPHEQGELYRARSRHFGTNRALRCPHHLDDGRCGVWKHRNAICSTWFCKHERGETGRKFWLAVRDFASAVEHTLAWHCVDSLGIDAERRERLVPRAGLVRGAMLVDGHPGGEPTPERLRALWGEWFGREEAFFLACAEIVDGLSWPDIQSIGRSHVAQARVDLEEAWRRLEQTRIPRDPHPGRWSVLRRDEDTALVEAYSSYDPLELPAGVVDLLRAIDGRPIEVVRHASDPDGLLTDDVVRRLLDYRVLEDPRHS